MTERQKQFTDIGFSKVDIDREFRNGFPEVIFGQGKKPEHAAAIFATLAKQHGRALATRVSPEMAEAIVAVMDGQQPLEYHEAARIVRFGTAPHMYPGTVTVLCAGTADLPVAEEAALTAEWLGCQVERIVDVGVAGIHRLLAKEEQLRNASVLIVVAGMEGALPSVVGGLVNRPVIAVPTSVGYGSHLQGLTPLLAMLTSCAAGISVVNIDNGFGAAVSAAAIQRLVWEAGQGG